MRITLPYLGLVVCRDVTAGYVLVAHIITFGACQYIGVISEFDLATITVDELLWSGWGCTVIGTGPYRRFPTPGDLAAPFADVNDVYAVRRTA